MRVSEQRYSIQAGAAKGRSPPDWYVDEPEKPMVYDLVFAALATLGSTRNYEMGPIPWNRVVDYFATRGVHAKSVGFHVALRCIWAMDAEIVKRQSEKVRSRAKQGASTNG